MKLSIVFEGTEEEIHAIAEHFCDGGGDQNMVPVEFDDEDKRIIFDYSKCWTAWGYDPKVDGPDLVITGKIIVEKP
jgi:hypothetical protein